MMTTARHWFSYGTDPLPTGDVLRDQDPIQAQRIADLFNSPAKADGEAGELSEGHADEQ